MARREIELSIECKGMSAEEFHVLYRAFKAQGISPRVRNPDPITYAAKTIHEIMVTIGPEVTAVAGFTAKQVYDWVSKIVQRKMKEREEGKVEVTIYGPNDKPLVTVVRKPEKVKRKS